MLFIKGPSSFRQHILKLVLGLLAFTCSAILVNVWINTTHSGKTQIFDTLSIGERVLKRVFVNRETQLVSSAQVLTDDFGFKQAVATEDSSTIKSVLNNHGARIEADLMALISLEGDLLSSTIPISSEYEKHHLISAQRKQKVLDTGGSTIWTVIQGQLYQGILLTVDAPTPIAIALVGFKVDKALLQDFDSITQLNTSIQFTLADGNHFSVSSLPHDEQDKVFENVDQELSWLALGLSKNRYVSRDFNLFDDNSNPVKVVVSADVDVLFSTFKRLQSSIFAISVGALLLAVLLSIALSQRIISPLSRLVGMTQKLASGAYEDFATKNRGIKELNQLTESFQIMQGNIQTRESKIRFQAQHDLSTGLYNRAHVAQLLSAKLSSNKHFRLFGFSIRGFRQLNDTFGHLNVDVYLRVFADRLKDLGGVASRISSNEFLWIPDDHRYLEKPMQDVLDIVAEPIQIDEIVMQPRITLVALNCPEDAKTTEALFTRVNIAFDEAINSNQYCLAFNLEYEQKYTRRLDIIKHLKIALDDIDSELSMVYQPKLHIRSGKVKHLEALIRWNSKVLGFVPPDEFIEIAEQANLIYKLTQWVIKRVIADLKLMHGQGYKLCAAINLSAKDIMQADLLPWIMTQLSQSDLPIDALSFELTESDLVSDAKTAAMHLNEYRNAGFRLAIDDFGTGYSSLAYLQNLPVSDIKIDKSFVLKLASKKGDQKIVKSIIALAKSFDMEVVAEGIEDQNSLMLLSEYGCDWAQGYHICRPCSIPQLLSWLTEHVANNQEQSDHA
jgi:predicted signal transduction protein with EAL and GGDEF domain